MDEVDQKRIDAAFETAKTQIAFSCGLDDEGAARAVKRMHETAREVLAELWACDPVRVQVAALVELAAAASEAWHREFRRRGDVFTMPGEITVPAEAIDAELAAALPRRVRMIRQGRAGSLEAAKNGDPAIDSKAAE